VKGFVSVSTYQPGDQIAKILIGRPGIAIAFVWGFAEATLFFIIPDVFLSFVAILDWRRTASHVFAALIGALLGGSLMFSWSTSDHQRARNAVLNVPFVRQRMLSKVDEGLRTQGMTAALLGSVSGVPYKLYAVEGPQFTTIGSFLLWTPLVRAFRFVIVWMGFGLVSVWLRSRLNWKNYRSFWIHSVIWVISYVLYWSRVIAG